MEFLIQPLEIIDFDQCTNQYCPQNKEQCGCNVVKLCACPQRIMEP